MRWKKHATIGTFFCPFPASSFLMHSTINHSPSRRHLPTSGQGRNFRHGVGCILCASPTRDMHDSLGLYDRFDRWRWLQQLLDEESDPVDTNTILYQVLALYLKNPTMDSEGSPALTLPRRAKLEIVVQNAQHGMVEALTDDMDAKLNEDLYNQLEQLLPDPEEDEDAFKSLWDIVMEVHGRESVRINEQSARPEWKIRCLVARVLLHYDFLSRGIPAT